MSLRARSNASVGNGNDSRHNGGGFTSNKTQQQETTSAAAGGRKEGQGIIIYYRGVIAIAALFTIAIVGSVIFVQLQGVSIRDDHEPVRVFEPNGAPEIMKVEPEHKEPVPVAGDLKVHNDGGNLVKVGDRGEYVSNERNALEALQKFSKKFASLAELAKDESFGPDLDALEMKASLAAKYISEGTTKEDIAITENLVEDLTGTLGNLVNVQFQKLLDLLENEGVGNEGQQKMKQLLESKMDTLRKKHDELKQLHEHQKKERRESRERSQQKRRELQEMSEEFQDESSQDNTQSDNQVVKAQRIEEKQQEKKDYRSKRMTFLHAFSIILLLVCFFFTLAVMITQQGQIPDFPYGNQYSTVKRKTLALIYTSPIYGFVLVLNHTLPKDALANIQMRPLQFLNLASLDTLAFYFLIFKTFFETLFMYQLASVLVSLSLGGDAGDIKSVARILALLALAASHFGWI